jgi:hypothetical protein
MAVQGENVRNPRRPFFVSESGQGQGSGLQRLDISDVSINYAIAEAMG